MNKKLSTYAITTYEQKEYSEKDFINSQISYFLGDIENLEVSINAGEFNKTCFNVNLGFIYLQISGRDFEKLFRQMVLIKDKNNEALINCDHKYCYFYDGENHVFKCVRDDPDFYAELEKNGDENEF